MSTVPSFQNANTPAVGANAPAPADQANQDASDQAAVDLGYLAYLARNYAALQAELAGASGSQAQAIQNQMNAILTIYNQIQSLYSVDASGNVTFTYTDAAGQSHTIQIQSNAQNAKILADIAAMKSTCTDITKYLAWANSETSNPLLDVFNYLKATNFSFANNGNETTRQDAIFFMMAMAGSPIGDLSGDVDEFLNAGQSSILPQENILAETIASMLAAENNPTLTAAITACLSVTTKDADYTQLEALFNSILAEPNWQVTYANQNILLEFESRYWPFIPYGTKTGEQAQKANAVPLSSRPQSDNSVLTDMHKNDTGGVYQPPKTLPRA